MTGEIRALLREDDIPGALVGVGRRERHYQCSGKKGTSEGGPSLGGRAWVTVTPPSVQDL